MWLRYVSLCYLTLTLQKCTYILCKLLLFMPKNFIHFYIYTLQNYYDVLYIWTCLVFQCLFFLVLSFQLASGLISIQNKTSALVETITSVLLCKVIYKHRLIYILSDFCCQLLVRLFWGFCWRAALLFQCSNSLWSNSRERTVLLCGLSHSFEGSG